MILFIVQLAFFNRGFCLGYALLEELNATMNTITIMYAHELLTQLLLKAMLKVLSTTYREKTFNIAYIIL